VNGEIEGFFRFCPQRDEAQGGSRSRLADSIAVILSNLAMDEGRRVYFNEIDKMGRGKRRRRRRRPTPVYSFGIAL